MKSPELRSAKAITYHHGIYFFRQAFPYTDGEAMQEYIQK